MLDPEGYIRDRLTKAALYEQMAEEAVELAHACQKMARICRKENPTPVTEEDAKQNVLEELTDVGICAVVLELEPELSEELFDAKIDRWCHRLDERE